VSDGTEHPERRHKCRADVTNAFPECGLAERLRRCGSSIRSHQGHELEEMKMLATSTMNEAAGVFASHKSRLLGIAYRMLGSHADAEDLVQDAYLRWHQSGSRDIESPTAFLVTVTRRLCLDRLRERKQSRVTYVDSSLSESVVEDCAPSPEARLASNQELSGAFRLVLERLGPAERATFLLYDVFDYDHREVAQILDKSEQCCRQTLHRARARLREPGSRFAVAPQSPQHQRLLKAFLLAADTGDRYAVAALLAEMGVAGRVERAVDTNQPMDRVRETESASVTAGEP
jgi:RNA polymerase sigma-70 factor (ECF subfamily)